MLLEVICGIVRYIATFVKAQGIIMSAIALTAAITLGIAGIKHGVLWGILAGILDALPFIGTGGGAGATGNLAAIGGKLR